MNAGRSSTTSAPNRDIRLPLLALSSPCVGPAPPVAHGCGYRLCRTKGSVAARWRTGGPEVSFARFVMRREGPAAVHRAILLLVLGMACLTAMDTRSEEHTSELPSLMRISYAVFCLIQKKLLNKHLHTILATII